MNFLEAEKTYKDLKAQHEAGKLNDATFEAEVGKLRMQDEQGRWWQIGVQSGDWYMHDGQKWSKAKPPIPVSAPAPQAQPVVEKPVTPVVAAAPVVNNKPADKKEKEKEKKAEPKTEAAPGQPRASAAPRLFSPKPAGREGGLSRRTLIGIIAGVAVLGALLLIGGYFLVTNLLGGTAKPPATPTRAIAVLPTQPIVVLPTLAPVPTSVPLPPPTPIVLPTTAPLTSTNPITGTLPITQTRPPAATRTPTKKPVTAGPSATPALNLPPGVYVSKIRTDPAKPAPGDITFYVTFANTGSYWSAANQPWLIKIYKPGDEIHSRGETSPIARDIPSGTVELAAAGWRIGAGDCDYTAIPFYKDTATGQLVRFPATNGKDQFRYDFSVCQ